jgi:P-type Cu+ transporter
LETELNTVKEEIICFHCGDVCPDEQIKTGDKYFCCSGCRTVYEILNENNLCNYYTLDSAPGLKQNTPVSKNKFEYLDDEKIISKLLDYSDGNFSKVTFILPQMHCSSCVWLLELLYKFSSGVTDSKVNFLKKEIYISFKKQEVSLRQVVELLTSIGYEPEINYENIKDKTKRADDKSIYYKIGIAGFVFANIMLLSFPEYLSLNPSDKQLKQFFSYVNVALSLPVLFYCSSGYFISAFQGIRKKIINIDFPLSLGITALYLRSLYEIFINSSPGYLDSFAGLLFLLLLGKLFQNKTYDTLNFERDYKSYFPISVTKIKNGLEKVIPLSDLAKGDRIVVRNNELIPADSILFSGQGNIDYSFVTGESDITIKTCGETVYAGGKHLGQAIELEVIKEVSQSYLTQLWNNNYPKMEERGITSLVNTASKYFTISILVIASLSFIYWAGININTAVNAFTSVLIIACPCAFAMSTPFTLGSTLRIFGKNKFYLKNIFVIELLAAVNAFVFDKTGTITQSGNSNVEYSGGVLSEYEKSLVKSIVKNSTHPLSVKINNYMAEVKNESVLNYKEFPGKGIEGLVDDRLIKIGSDKFVGVNETADEGKIGVKKSSKVFVKIDDEIKGHFAICNDYRNGLSEVISSLKKKYKLFLLSGDNNDEMEQLSGIFPAASELYFNQSPSDKLNFIKKLQSGGNRVLMIGDGLNDAGALLQSDVGISISENVSNFSPACDAILDAGSFKKLSVFIEFAKTSLTIIKVSFAVSFLYNLAGLVVAVQGMLSPLFAAVLMPLSSVSVVVFATVSTNYTAKRKGLI